MKNWSYSAWTYRASRSCYLFMYGARKEDETMAAAAAARATAHCVLCTCSSICWCHLPNGVLPQPKQSKFKSETRWILSAAFMCRHKHTLTNTPLPHTFTRCVSEYCAYAQFKFKKAQIHQRNFWATQILRSNFDFIEWMLFIMLTFQTYFPFFLFSLLKSLWRVCVCVERVECSSNTWTMRYDSLLLSLNFKWKIQLWQV